MSEWNHLEVRPDEVPQAARSDAVRIFPPDDSANRSFAMPRQREVFWIADPVSQQLLFVSTSVEQLFGLSAATVLKDAMQWNYSLVPADSHMLPRPFFADEHLDGESDLREYRIVGADLHTYWIRDRRFSNPDPLSGAPRVYGLAQDVSELKAWQAGQTRQPQAWFSLIMHELRTPLHAIQGWVHVLRQLEPRSPLRQKAFDTIERNVQAQSLVIEELLDSQLLRAGQLTLSLDTVSLAPTIDTAAAMMRSQAQSNAISIEVQHHHDVGVVRADRARLGLVLASLLRHAIKVATPGTHVCIRSESGASLARISISLTRGGVAPLLTQLPLQFVSAASTRAEACQPGASIGLHLARQLIELHGGRLVIWNAALRSATMFTIELPDPRRPSA